MKKFLIVDDDADDREMFCEALQDALQDCLCYSVPNGRRAMIALDNGEIGIPDLIFLDINMPMMNGWQCLARLKETEEYKNIPVIIYSTSSYPEDLEKSQHGGALCFFTKPSNFQQLKQSLALVVDHVKTESLESLMDSSPLFIK